jgi:hypothetical protein
LPHQCNQSMTKTTKMMSSLLLMEAYVSFKTRLWIKENTIQMALILANNWLVFHWEMKKVNGISVVNLINCQIKEM